MIMRTLQTLCFSGAALLSLIACEANTGAATGADWTIVDDFERTQLGPAWTIIDAQNETDPFVKNPQISEIRSESGNRFLMRKPAADGIVGNRKALIYTPLPEAIAVGDTYTLYCRVSVEYFPNNHSYGLTNIAAENIAAENYNAFEPMIRITDKTETNGDKNDGTLMVLSGYKTYAKIQNSNINAPAEPMVPGTWYEVWTVINNAPKSAGGQSYDLYVRGGAFTDQSKVYTGATFRMNREAPLTGFVAITNTGPKKSPYGNGGVGYDDIYMAKGTQLSTPE